MMLPIRTLCMVAMSLGLTSFAVAKDSGPTLQDRQQAACYADVQRLCGAAMPDVAKVTDCMKDKRPQVSAKCSSMWDIKG